MTCDLRPIPGIDGYFVSSTGEIFSMKTGSMKRLSLRRGASGYLTFGPVVGGKQRCVSVHRAVAEAFIPNPDSLAQVNHIDSDKLNNKVENLEWCTQRENVDHAVENNLYARCGKRAPLSDAQRAEIHAAFASRSGRRWGAARLGKKFGVSASTVRHVATWATKGRAS